MTKPIRFRSPTGEMMLVATTSAQSARIGPEWRELPLSLHAAAIAAGAITDNMDVRVAAEREAPNEPAPPFDADAAIRDGIVKMIDANDPKLFTGAGKPSLKELSKLVGFDVDRVDAERVFAKMTEEAGKAI